MSMSRIDNPLRHTTNRPEAPPNPPKKPAEKFLVYVGELSDGPWVRWMGCDSVQLDGVFSRADLYRVLDALRAMDTREGGYDPI